MDRCKICSSENTKIMLVKEKHYATFDTFEYIYCSKCKSLSLKNFPENLKKYYQNDYYSFEKKTIHIKTLSALYWRFFISGNQFIKNILNFLKKQENEHFFKILSTMNINTKSKILDIGCGSGTRLKMLYSFGFKNVIGLEPHIEDDITYLNNILVKKSYLEDYASDCNEKYDLIMMNHSFEHMPNPDQVIKCLFNLSHENTKLLIRVPLSNSYAFRKYKENWVQLDAPRHLFLYSEAGLKHVLNRGGFKFIDSFYDSTEFQFWGSEQYMRDIPLRFDNSYAVNKDKSIFNDEQIENYKIIAKELNKKKDGDMAAFIFMKK